MKSIKVIYKNIEDGSINYDYLQYDNLLSDCLATFRDLFSYPIYVLSITHLD